MANRRPQPPGGRRMDFVRNDRAKNFGRSGVSPWQGGGPGGSGLPNLLPLAGGPTEATLALASNIINLLQPRQNPVPSLLDMPIRRDFGPAMNRFDRGFVPNRMGNQNFRRTGNYNRAGERINNRKPFKPNDGQRQQNKSSPKKEADSKAKPKESQDDQQGKSETNEDSKDQETEDKKDVPKTRYDDINSQLLKCHICNKSMWDGRSFENHLNGRAHSIMMQKTAESYALTADTMRQEFKIREMKRTRKTGQQPTRDFYCAMCDMYAGDGAVHRTTVGHRKLKKYLHPTCTSCHKEMPTRIELDEHRLTAEHLKNMQDKQDVTTKPKPEVMVISTLTMEQSYLNDERYRRRRYEHHAGARQENKDGDNQEPEVKQEKEDGDVEMKEEKKEVVDPENTVLDYKEGDDLTGVSSQLFPSYNTERGVGSSFIAEFSCFQCKLCRKLLDSQETADVHLRTRKHHQLFIRLLHEKTGSNQSTTDQQESGKRANNSEQSGNWKRRKTSPEPDEHNINDDEDDVHVKEEPDCEAANGEAEAANGNTEAASGEADAASGERDAANGEDFGDAEMPSADDLEDWEHAVDEVLADEKVDDGEEKNKTAAEVKKPVEEVKEVEKVVEKPSPVKASTRTPRGRGRGRGRRY